MPFVSRAHPTSVQPCLAHLDRLCPTLWFPPPRVLKPSVSSFLSAGLSSYVAISHSVASQLSEHEDDFVDAFRVKSASHECAAVPSTPR